MTKDKDMFNKLQQEQRDLDASYRQSLQNKKEHETRDQDQASSNKGKGNIYCRTKECKNHLYGRKRNLAARNCICILDNSYAADEQT